ncbi:MAG: AAA domain-containing protein [Saprospiraceae bacterium]
MKEQELARLYYREIEKIVDDAEVSLDDKIEALYFFLHKLFFDITQSERVHFTTLFARIAFSSHKYQIDKDIQFYTFLFRKSALTGRKRNQQIREKDFLLGIIVCCETIRSFYGFSAPESLSSLMPEKEFYPVKPLEIKERFTKIRVLAVEDVPEKEILLAKAEDYPERILEIKYNDRRNENFMPSIIAIRKVIGFPVMLNLIDVIVEKDDVLTPRAFVVEPDYLMDVTAVAECFKENNATEPLSFLLNRFLPKETSVHILMGNIANFFLDELMVDPTLTFDSIFSKCFALSPFTFALMSDVEIRDVREKARLHFFNIRKVILEQFETEDLNRRNCFLEPSFYSETYGLQGRLDVLHLHPSDPKKTAIVELKSGKPFKPNGYQVSHSHYTQTLLYDLMIKSAYGEETVPQNFILYSQMDNNTLRFAPAVKAQQYEALNQRNQLIALEHAVFFGRPTRIEEAAQPLENGAIYKKLKASSFQNSGFFARDVELFERVYQQMNEMEKAYFQAFSSMIATEHRLAKTGIQGVENANGVASLWLNSTDEKDENFQVLKGLTIEENHTMEEDPIIVFNRTGSTNALANFRAGDVAVLSAGLLGTETETTIAASSVLHNQVFKGTILQVSPDKIWFRLRARQFNQRVFDSNPFWNIEPDMYDSSFLAMYKGLFALMSAPVEKRNTLLSVGPPAMRLFPLEHQQALEMMTEEQQRIFQKMISCKDYFLLWGPPGTGKTSVMLRYLAKYMLEETKENVLFLAYTNRAVDEICEAIEANGAAYRDAYLRIGSRYATHPNFHDNLLEKRMENIKSRTALKELIESKRVFVATVASMHTKPELLKLKQFDTVVVDEASQILEPQILGLLSKMPRFILIGDHRQLPAVVTQPIDQSKVDHPLLLEIGLNNLRNSFFERLYLRCCANNWHWAFDQLSRQGRMHQEIVDFPSRHFYEQNLHILPTGWNAGQTALLGYQLPNNCTVLEKALAERRKMFIPTPKDFSSGNGKVNVHEAEKVVEIIEAYQRIYQASGLEMHAGSLGVITPFRAQIAQILHVMQEKGIDNSMITVDTVERYQGGARDIILISLCTNSARQLQQMISLSNDGTDRKLNVALTRARKHLVVLGNEPILSETPIYNALINWLKP